jgi:hypothetical protein
VSKEHSLLSVFFTLGKKAFLPSFFSSVFLLALGKEVPLPSARKKTLGKDPNSSSDI